jgi:DNA-directed RNA polymerase alpha subunit
MNPVINNTHENDNNTFTFTLSGVNVSLANALRRTIIADIPTVVFKTAPYEQNKAVIFKNTSRLNNEILKQRLSCIPIHITDENMPLENYLLEVNVENTTDTIQYVTTEHFKIKNIKTDEFLTKKDNDKIFPPDSFTGYYIDFVRLRPKITDEIPGEKLHFTCEFSYGTCKEDAMFNTSSVCSYGMTCDTVNSKIELGKKKQIWKNENFSEEDIIFKSKDWELLDAARIIIKDSFDFTIQSVGVFTNQDLIQKAITIIINKLQEIENIIDSGDLDITVSENTMKNCFDIKLKNEDYTIGKILEYALHSKYYQELKTITYCGFVKLHPHDNDSIIRIAYKELPEKSLIYQNLKECIHNLIIAFQIIFDKF